LLISTGWRIENPLKREILDSLKKVDNIYTILTFFGKSLKIDFLRLPHEEIEYKDCNGMHLAFPMYF
jgi:hypothetical protein